MSSTTASTSKDAAKAAEPTKEQQSLGILEEDDEFEEFPVADWDDSQTDLASVAPGPSKSGGGKLWEDNWDDDDIEEDFSVQLRAELAKTQSGDAMEQ